MSMERVTQIAMKQKGNRVPQAAAGAPGYAH